jgi:hypothetical protein
LRGRGRHSIFGPGMASNNDKGYAEASYIGIGFGTVGGGMVLGAAADALAAPIHPMLAYAIGGVLGGLAGMVLGRLAAAMLLD